MGIFYLVFLPAGADFQPKKKADNTGDTSREREQPSFRRIGSFRRIRRIRCLPVGGVDWLGPSKIPFFFQGIQKDFPLLCEIGFFAFDFLDWSFFELPVHKQE